VKAIEYTKYDAAYIFKYSPRPGTPAFEMVDDVSADEKTERFRELEAVQKRSQADSQMRYIGKSLKVLVEKKSSFSNTQVSGHSTCHKVVNFEAPSDMLGKIVDVRISEVKSNSLFGTLN
jgi:tRNA-2-methylthio-N6-dimethylallyladenosine synthase